MSSQHCFPETCRKALSQTPFHHASTGSRMKNTQSKDSRDRTAKEEQEWDVSIDTLQHEIELGHQKPPVIFTGR